MLIKCIKKVIVICVNLCFARVNINILNNIKELVFNVCKLNVEF